MANPLHRFKRNKKADTDKTPERITNETVAEHRERVLAGGRRFKYPMQYARVRLIRNTIIIAVVAVLALSALTWWQLYQQQATNRIIYRVTEILPLPVAKIDGTNVPYSYYLLELRSQMHFLADTNVNFNSDDGKRQLDFVKRSTLNKVEETYFAKKLANENNISVSDKEVDDFIARRLSANSQATNEQAFSRAIMDNYGWSYNEFKTSVKLNLLKRKVTEAIDDQARGKAQNLASAAKSNQDFAQLARENSDQEGAVQSGGDIGVVPRNSEDPNGLIAAAGKLQAGQVSDVITGTNGFYIIKVAEINDTNVRFSQIFISFKEFQNRLNAIRSNNGIKEYINVPTDTNAVNR